MTNKLYPVLWIASLALSFWLGLQRGQQKNQARETFEIAAAGKKPDFEDPNRDEVKTSPAATPGTATLNETSQYDGLATDGSKSNADTLQAREKSFEEKLSSSNPVLRLRGFAELLERSSEGKLDKAREIFENLPEGQQRFSELRMLAYTWGQSDPRAALVWTENLDDFERRLGVVSVLDSWSRYDSESAISWAKENYDGEDNPYFLGIISGMSENNLIGATELMTSLPYGRTRGRAASILVEKSWRMGEDVALHLAEHLPEGSVQNYVFGEIGEKMAKENLERAVQWVESMEESEIKVAVSEDVAERWARKSPEEAARWVSQMPEGEARSESMEEVVAQWARKDPTATAEWLNQFPSGELMDEPIQRFVREIARKDPESALSWAQSIVDEERRKRVEADVLRIQEMQARRQQAEADGGPDPQGGRRPRGGSSP